MEPKTKRAKLLTDHFRVVLKPRDLNLLQNKNKNKSLEIDLVGPEEGELHQQDSDGAAAALKRNAEPPRKQPGLSNNNNLINRLKTQQTSNNNKTITSNNHTLESLFKKNARPHQQSIKSPILLKKSRQSLASNGGGQKAITTIKQQQQPIKPQITTTTTTTSTILFDYDKTQLHNVIWEPHYARDSFEYDRQQEVKFRTIKYLEEEKLDFIERSLTIRRRAELVEFLVELQMSFSLDHEALYMAIKLVDQYLMLKPLVKDEYYSLFVTCILISAKFDERVPPFTISNLIQLLKTRFGVRYTRRQITALEVDILKTLDFDIRYPLSYGFLRRFARCTRSDLKTLTLARYILETSLMEYEMIDILESKMAASCLLLAFHMMHLDGAWDETAKYHTGYNEDELHPIIIRLNTMIMNFTKQKTIIRRKYQNPEYMEVARIPPILPEILAQIR